MLIRVTLFLVLFLLVVKGGYQYRDAVKSKVFANEPEVRLALEEPQSHANYLKAMALYKPGDPLRSEAISREASVCLQRSRYDDAERNYKIVQLESPPIESSRYESNAGSLHLAYVFTVEAKLQNAKEIYLSLLNDDRKYLGKNDLRIARDLSNLGLNAYLMALGEERGDSRTGHLRQAIDYYKQALLIIGSQPKTEKALQTKSVVLNNEHLALRDLNDLEGAELANNEAKTIWAQFKDPYSLP